MTAPRPGDAFRMELDGEVIAGRYIEVDSPRRMLIGWDRRATGNTAQEPALIEFMFTPRGTETTVEVEVFGLGVEEAEFYSPLFARYLDRIKAAFPAADSGMRCS